MPWIRNSAHGILPTGVSGCASAGPLDVCHPDRGATTTQVPCGHGPVATEGSDGAAGAAVPVAFLQHDRALPDAPGMSNTRRRAVR